MSKVSSNLRTLICSLQITLHATVSYIIAIWILGQSAEKECKTIEIHSLPVIAGCYDINFLYFAIITVLIAVLILSRKLFLTPRSMSFSGNRSLLIELHSFIAVSLSNIFLYYYLDLSPAYGIGTIACLLSIVILAPFYVGPIDEKDDRSSGSSAEEKQQS